MNNKPSFVFVPGAWHRAEAWGLVIPPIEQAGHRCTAVMLPSTLSDPSISFGDDVRAVQGAVEAETTQGHDVVIVVHSYGGHVGNSAIKGFANKAKSFEEHGPGQIIGLAMIATGFTVTGLSFLGMIGGKPPPLWIADTETGFATLVADPREAFYHDLPEEQGRLWVSKLTKHSLKSLSEGEEYAYSGWQDVPCWYLVTAEDKALPGDAQRLAVKMAQDAGADVTMREIATSHSPMLSKPQETANFLLDAATYFASNH